MTEGGTGKAGDGNKMKGFNVPTKLPNYTEKYGPLTTNDDAILIISGQTYIGFVCVDLQQLFLRVCVCVCC